MSLSIKDLTRGQKIELLLQLVGEDDFVLKSVLEYVRNAKFQREESLHELKKRLERADEWLLDAALSFAVSSKH